MPRRTKALRGHAQRGAHLGPKATTRAPGAAGTDDAIDHGPGAHQIMDEEEQHPVHVRRQRCCRGVADDDVNVVPPVLGHAGTGVSGHGFAQIDARDVTGRTDSCYQVGKVRPGTTANVEHVVAGPQAEAADHARAPAVG